MFRRSPVVRIGRPNKQPYIPALPRPTIGNIPIPDITNTERERGLGRSHYIVHLIKKPESTAKREGFIVGWAKRAIFFMLKNETLSVICAV